MGGDFDPLSCISPIDRFLSDYPDTFISVHLTKENLREFEQQFGDHSRVAIKVSEAFVSPEDSPIQKLDRSNTTMSAALVAAKHRGVAMSSGNTGVLMALSRKVIGRMQGVRRPAIAAWVPNLKGEHTLLLDVGANLVLSAQHLHELAQTGSQYLTNNDQKPRVGLLNLGTEHHKGTATIQQVNQLLMQDATINYVGFVEPNTLFDIECDLVVTDGYSGNLLIKSAEGVCHFTYHEMLRAGVAIEQLVESRLDYRKYNGAVIVGLNKPVFKSHGAADAFAFYSAIVNARNFCI